MKRTEQYLQFIKETEQLKSVCRTAWTKSGRQESTAEHSWRLTLLAALYLNEYPQLDGKRVQLMCLIHDLGEIYDGDISAVLLPDEREKHRQEEQAVLRVLSCLPEEVREEWYRIWKEYNDNVTPEARLVKALDKAETIIQHNQGKNPEHFDYEFNLHYGAPYFEGDEVMKDLRGRLDGETKVHLTAESSGQQEPERKILTEY